MPKLPNATDLVTFGIIVTASQRLQVAHFQVDYRDLYLFLMKEENRDNGRAVEPPSKPGVRLGCNI